MPISFTYVRSLQTFDTKTPSNLTSAAAEVEARQYLAVAVLCTETWQVRLLLYFSDSTLRPLVNAVPSRGYVSAVHDHFGLHPASDLLVQGDPPRSSSQTSIGFLQSSLIALRLTRSRPVPLVSFHSKVRHWSHISNTERRWNSSFVRNCVSKTVDATVGNKVTSYSAILQLDSEIREYSVPTEISDFLNNPGEDESIGTIMQGACIVNLRAVCECLRPNLKRHHAHRVFQVFCFCTNASLPLLSETLQRIL
jgi:hypothetical protein